MSTLVLDTRDVAFIVGTRAALAAGAALLAGSSFSEERRRIVGTALLGLGLVTTVPAIQMVFRGLRRPRYSGSESGIQYDRRLIGATRFPRKGDDDRV